MSTDIDRILDRVQTLSRELDGLEPDDPGRGSLEDERSRLRAEARQLAAQRRNPVSVEREVEMLEARLDEIVGQRIKPGYSENHLGRTIQDPGAYRYAINRALDDHHAREVAAIEERLALLRPLATGQIPDGLEDGTAS